MNHLSRTSTSFRLHGPGALIQIALLLGCGGGSSGGGEAEPEIECEAPLLAVSEGQPLDEIALEGIPEDFGPLLAAKVLAEEASSLAVITREGDGSLLLAAPIYPTGSGEGGEVMLEIIDSTGRSCPPIPFTILPLPPAPGATEEMLVHLEAILQGQATYFETSVAALRDMELDEVSEEHLSLYLAQHGLNDEENPNSLRALLDGTAPLLEGVELDLDLIDRLLAKVGFPDMLRELVGEMETLLEEEPLRGQEVFGIQEQQAGLDSIQNAHQLHLEMEMAQWGDRYQREGALKRTASGVATAVAGVGLIPLPQAKLASTVVGGGLFTFLKATEAAAKLLPSRFASIDFELTKPAFNDDDPSIGEWQKVEVVAASLGMNLDQTALETILELFKFKDGLDDWMARFLPQESKDIILNVLLDISVAGALDTTGQGEGFLHIPPKMTAPIDITEEPWSFAELHGSLVADGRQGYRLSGVWEGTHQHGAVRIGTALGMFGGQHIFATQSVPIHLIQIEATPDFVLVDLEENVEFTVVVEGAHDPSITVVTEAGHTTHQPQPDGSHLLQYTAPLADASLPTRILLESDTHTGMYRDPNYPRATAEIGIFAKTPFIVVDPSAACLEHGESLDFTASVYGLEDEEVRWEASAGSITRAGRYTAPGRDGEVEITATSVENDEVTATAYVQVGGCTGAWSVSLRGTASINKIGDDARVQLRPDGSVAALRFAVEDSGLLSSYVCVGFPRGVEVGDSGTYMGWGVGRLVDEGSTLFEGFSVTLTLDRLDAIDWYEDEPVSFAIEGSANGEVAAAMINGEGFNEPFPTLNFDLEFQAPEVERSYAALGCPYPDPP